MSKEELAVKLPNIIGRDCEIFTKVIVYEEEYIIVNYLSSNNEALFSFKVENKHDAESIVNTLYNNNFHIYNSRMENLNYDTLWKELM